MLSKIKNYIQNFPWSYLRDTKVFGLLVFLVIVLLVTWSGVKAIQTNYGLQRQISQLKAEVQVQQLENTNVQLSNEYYNTNQYLELSARQNFGLAAPGETELIVPQNVALAHVVSLNEASTIVSKSGTDQPTWQRNFQAWVNFLLHRQTSG